MFCFSVGTGNWSQGCSHMLRKYFTPGPCLQPIRSDAIEFNSENNFVWITWIAIYVKLSILLTDYFKNQKEENWVVVAHTFDPSKSQHSGARGRKISVSSRPVCSTEWVPLTARELHRETLSQTNQNLNHVAQQSQVTLDARLHYMHHTYLL